MFESIKFVLPISSESKSEDVVSRLARILRDEYTDCVNEKKLKWRTLWGFPLRRLLILENDHPMIKEGVQICEGNNFAFVKIENCESAHHSSEVTTTTQDSQNDDTTGFQLEWHSNQANHKQLLQTLSEELRRMKWELTRYDWIESPTDNTSIVIFCPLSSSITIPDQMHFLGDLMLMLTSPTFLIEMGQSRGTLSASEKKRHLLKLRSSEAPIGKRGDRFFCRELVNLVTLEDYDALDANLASARLECRQLCHNIRSCGEKGCTEPSQKAFAQTIGSDFLDWQKFWFEPPIRFDYGFNTYIDDDVYMNFDCLLLDTGLIQVKSGTKFGPAVHIYTANHPLEPTLRLKRTDFNLPVEIGYDCWIGGHAVIVPGVRIGDGVTVGAGSVVTKDLPTGSIAAGTPAKILRRVPYDHAKMRALRETHGWGKNLQNA